MQGGKEIWKQRSGFSQSGNMNKIDMSKIKCYNWDKMGHCACEWPDIKYSEDKDFNLNITTTMEAAKMGNYGEFKEFAFIQAWNKTNKDWILLNNQYTVDVFCKNRLLRNIRNYCRHVKINGNIGIKEVVLIGDLQNHSTIWYASEGITNTLSLSNVNNKLPVS